MKIKVNVETNVEIKGECIGIRVHDRGKNDVMQSITVMIEDDENWIDHLTIDAYWLDDMLEVLNAVKDYLDKHCEKHIWGYRRKV